MTSLEMKMLDTLRGILAKNEPLRGYMHDGSDVDRISLSHNDVQALREIIREAESAFARNA